MRCGRTRPLTSLSWSTGLSSDAGEGRCERGRKFPFTVVASCVSRIRMNENTTPSRSFIVVEVGDDVETFPVVRLEVSQSRRSRRDVSAARTFHNHDVFPVLDMFEARRTVPVADSSEGQCHPRSQHRLAWIKVRTHITFAPFKCYPSIQ